MMHSPTASHGSDRGATTVAPVSTTAHGRRVQGAAMTVEPPAPSRERLRCSDRGGVLRVVGASVYCDPCTDAAGDALGLADPF